MPPLDPPPEGAIDLSVPSVSSPAGWGAFQTTAPQAPPPRDAISYIADTALGMVQGGIGIAGGLAGAATRLPEAPGVLPPMESRRETQTYLQDLSHAVGQYKSKAGRAEEEAGGPDITTDPMHTLTQGVAGLLPYAPVMMTGPVAAPLIFGATSIGDVANKISEKIRFADEKDLMQAPVYRETLQRTGSKEQAQEALYQATNDLASNLIAGGAGAAGGGLLTAMAGKLGNRFLSKVIGDRIMHGWASRLGFGGAEGFGAGALMTGGTEYGTEQSLHQAGLGPPPDLRKIGIEAAKSGATLGIIGGAGKLAFGQRPAAPLNVDLEATAMAKEGYGPIGAKAGRPTPGREMEPGETGEFGDLAPTGPTGRERYLTQTPPPEIPIHRGPMGEYRGAEYGPEITPRAPPAEMAGEDLGPGAGRLDVSRGPMTAEDIGAQEPPGVMTQGDLGMGSEYGIEAPGRQIRQGPVPGRWRMRQEDIMSEYGPEIEPPPPPPTMAGGFRARTAIAEARRRGDERRRAAVQGDIFDELGPEGQPRPPLRGGERPMELGDIMSEYGPEVPPRTPPSPTGGGFASRTARAEELRAMRRRQMQQGDILDELGPEVEPGGDIVQAGREMLPEDIYEPGSREHGRAQANAMLDQLEAMKRRREYMAKRGQTRGLNQLDKQITALRQRLIAHNRALREGRPPPEVPEAKPRRGGGPPEEPPPGGGEAPTEPSSEVVQFRPPDLDPRFATFDNDELQAALDHYRGQEQEHVDAFTRARDAGDVAGMRRHGDEAERHANIADNIEDELNERRRSPQTAERLRQERLEDERARGEMTRAEQDDDSLHGVSGRQMMEDLGITPHRAGRGGEERLLPETANQPGREILRGTTAQMERARARLQERERAKVETTKLRGEPSAELTPERGGRKGELIIRKAQERAEARRRVETEAEKGEGAPVEVRSQRVLSMEARTERERREAAMKEAQERRRVAAEREAGTNEAMRQALETMARTEAERQGERRRQLRVGRRLARKFRNIASYTGQLLLENIAKMRGQRLSVTPIIERVADAAAAVRRRASDRQRRRDERNRHYEIREGYAKTALLGDENNLSIPDLTRLAIEGYTPQFAEGEWGIFTPRGKRGEKLLTQGVDPETLPLRRQLDLFTQAIDRTPHEHLRNVAQQIRDDVQSRIEAGREAYKQMREYLAAIGETPRIRLGINDRRGRGDWHRQFAALRQFQTAVDGIIKKGGSFDTAHTPKQREDAYYRLRQLITNHYEREMALRTGGIAQMDKMDRAALRAAKAQITSTKLTGERRGRLSARERFALNQAEAIVDRALGPEAESEAVQPERYGRDTEPEIASSLEEDVFRQTYEDMPNIIYRVQQLLNVLLPRYGSDYVRDAQRKVVEDWLDEYTRRMNIDRERQPGERPRTLEEYFAGLGEDAERNRILTQRFGTAFHAMAPEYKQLSIDYGTLITPRDVLDTVAARRIWERRQADLAARSGEPAIYRDIAGQEQTALNQHRSLSAGDLYLPIQEQLEFIRRLQGGAEVPSETDLALRGQQLVDKAGRLHDALQSFDPALWTDPNWNWTGDNLQRVHRETRERAGEVPENPADVTPELVQSDFRRWESDLQNIENEARFHYERMNPDAQHMEYGVGNVLDPASDLRRTGELPRGAYVTKASDYTAGALEPKGPGPYGIRADHEIVRHFVNVAHDLVGDLDVAHLTDEQMNMAATERGLKSDTPSFYDRPTDRIIVRQSAMQGAERNRLLIHELAHPIMEAATQIPKLAPVVRRLEEHRALLERAFLDSDHPQHDDVVRLLDGKPHGLDNVHEFFSELWSNPDFASALHIIPTTAAQRARWMTGKRETLLEAVLHDIKRGLHGMFFSVSKNRLLNDSTIAGLDLLDRLQEGGRPRPLYREVPGEPLARAAERDRKPMPEKEQKVWDRAPVVDMDRVFHLGEREGKSYAIDEAGRIHDVGDHHIHIGNILEARGEHPGMEHGAHPMFENYDLMENEETTRPWVHIGVFNDGQGSISMGVEHTPDTNALTSAQYATLKRVMAERGKLNRQGQAIGMSYQSRVLNAPSGEQRARGRSYERAMAAKYKGVGEVRSATSYAQRMIDFGQSKYAPIMRTIKPLLEGAEVHIIPEMQFREGVEFYDPTLNKVYLKDTSNPQTQVHELIHAATARAISYHPELRKALDRIIEEIKGSKEFQRYIKDEGTYGTKHYFTTKAEEFVAEFYANPQVRALLDRMQASPALLRDLKVTPGKKSLLRATLDLITKWLNRSARSRGTVGELSANLIGDVLKAQADLPKMSIPEWHAHEFGPPRLYAPRRVGGSLPARPSEGFVKDVWQGLTERGKDIAAHVNSNGGPTGLMVKVMNFADLARTAEQGWQGHVQKILDLKHEELQKQKEIMEKEDHQHIRALADELRVKSPAHVEGVLDYMDRENYVGAAGDAKLGEGANKWVGDREEPGNRQVHNEHPELERMWNALPESSQKMVRGLRDYYRGRYDAIRDATLRDLVHLRGFVEGQHAGATEALMKLITEGRDELSTVEKDLLNKHVRGYDGYDKPEADRSKDNKEFRDYLGQMRGLPEFKKIQGVYYPMMRRGDYVVEAHAKLDRFAEPFGGVEQDREPGGPPTGHWEFPTKDGANQFVDRMSQDDAPFLKIQNAYETADGKWRVDVNPLHLNFHASLRSAQMEHAALSRDPDMETYNLQARLDHGKYAMNPTWATALMKNMIEGTKRTAAYRGLDESTQEILSRQWNDLAVRHLMSTSARSRYLSRGYTSGASRNALDNLLQYSSNTSHTLAEKQMAPQLRDAIAAMDKYERDMRGAKDPELEKWGLRRSQVRNEVHNRLRMRNDYMASPVVTKVLQTVLKMSFLDKLMSPGFLLLNASEPWTIAAPMLAGEHGAKAYGEIAKAYSILGSGRVWAQGGADFAKVLKAGIHGDPQLADTMKLLTQKIRDTGFSDKYSTPEQLIDMLENLQKHGYLDRNAGMELERILDPNANVAGKFLNYLDNAFRQANVQVENVNRGVAGIAGYRLAKMKGATHEEAMAKAQDIVDKSAGNYGYINAPAIFNHPHLKFAFQFKKYALRQTSNIIRVIAGAVRGEPTQMAQLVAMLASQQVISGALGMPTEPFKAMITATNKLGLNPYNTDDVERILNERLAGILGRQGKDAFLYGLPRLLGTGFGARTGWDTLWTYGTLGNKRDDMATAVGHLAGGAPLGMIAEWAQGGQDLSQGIASYMHGAHTQGADSMVNAARLLIPIKVVADAFPALHDYFTGRQKPSGQPFDFKPTVLDTIQRVGGVRTSRDLAASQARGAFIQQRDQYNAERTRALQGYAGARTPQEKAAVRDYILKTWNTGRPDVQKITIGDMYKATTAFENKAKLSPSDLGLAITTRTRPFAPNPNVYGFMPSGR